MPIMIREHALECAAFLKELRATANAKLSAERTGVPMHRFRSRRARFADFAADWDAALAFARAALASEQAGAGAAGFAAPDRAGPDGTPATLALGGEMAVRAGGRRDAQVRRARPGDLTGEGVRAFLAHLAATANVTLSARAVGVSKVAIYNRARRSGPFRREMQRAIAMGVERVDLALAATAMNGLLHDGADVRGWEEPSLALDPLALMTPLEALSAADQHRQTVLHGGLRAGGKRPRWTQDETDALLAQMLDREQRRAARDGQGG